jgi:hypothetical protein
MLAGIGVVSASPVLGTEYLGNMPKIIYRQFFTAGTEATDETVE